MTAPGFSTKSLLSFIPFHFKNHNHGPSVPQWKNKSTCWQMDKIKHYAALWWPTLPRYHPCRALFFSLPHSSSLVSGERVKTFSPLPPAARLLVAVLGFQERRCKISDRRFRCKLTTAPLTGSSLTGQEVCVHRAAGTSHGPRKLLNCGAPSVHAERFLISSDLCSFVKFPGQKKRSKLNKGFPNHACCTNHSSINHSYVLQTLAIKSCSNQKHYTGNDALCTTFAH